MQNKLRRIPKVDKLLSHQKLSSYPQSLIKKIIQNQLYSLRLEIQQNPSKTFCEDEIINEVISRYYSLTHSSIQPLINATGIIVQTNFGRSIFNQKIVSKIIPLLTEYSNLEYDLLKGKRGDRNDHIKEIICMLFDCEDAIVVNNNAAAVMLIINTFAKNKEVVISRGELVEIGGSFRIPEVITGAGGILCEIGSTNKTHLKDYENAINENTAIIAKIHQSNFTQIGFTQEVDFHLIQKLAQEKGLIDFYDIGSGYLTGIPNLSEPSLLEIASLKPSLVSFSGDKLLGAGQAGIIFGKKNLISKLKQNHLLRALRIDKINLAILAETLIAYLKEDFNLIPTIKLLSQNQGDLLKKAEFLQDLLKPIGNFTCKIIPTEAKAGGGSLPRDSFQSYGILLKHSTINTSKLSRELRLSRLMHRVIQDSVLIDVFCLEKSHFSQIKIILESIQNS